MTEREAALAARVAELEAVASTRPKPGGNIVEQIWRYLSYYVPPSIILVGLVVFLGFHAWEYYNSSLKTAAETRIKQAQAAIKRSEADASIADIGGVQQRIARLQAELDLKKQQARKAQIERDALKTEADGLSLEVDRVQTEIQNKQAQAAAARIEADNLMQKSGLTTLAKDLEATKLALEEFEVAAGQADLETQKEFQKNSMRASVGFVRAWCASKFAKELGCAQVAAQRRHQMRITQDNTKMMKCENNGKDCVTLGVLKRDWIVTAIGDASNGWIWIETYTERGAVAAWVSTDNIVEK